MMKSCGYELIKGIRLFNYHPVNELKRSDVTELWGAAATRRRVRDTSASNQTDVLESSECSCHVPPSCKLKSKNSLSNTKTDGTTTRRSSKSEG